MVVIYCAKDKEAKVSKELKLKEPHVFMSPTETGVNHTANKVIIVGPHEAIAERYKGIASVEFLELDEKKPKKEEKAD